MTQMTQIGKSKSRISRKGAKDAKGKRKTAHPQISQMTQIGKAKAGSLAKARRTQRGKEELRIHRFRRLHRSQSQKPDFTQRRKGRTGEKKNCASALMPLIHQFKNL
jgi:hypothetical protein